MCFAPVRSAIVRATRSTLSCARALSPQFADRLADDAFAILVQFGMRAKLLRRHARIRHRRPPIESLKLHRMSREDLLAKGRTIGSRLLLAQHLNRHAGHLDVNVDPLQQRSADPGQVPVDLIR
jgi:hypothetical protein